MRTLIPLVCMTIGVVVVPAAPAAEAVVPGPNGRIVFISNRFGSNEIFVMNADGTHQTRLTWTKEKERTPRWSPDGTRIAYMRGGDIWVMWADGSHQTNITNSPNTYELTPAWSPDGTKVAFSSSAGSYDIFVTDANGGHPRDITNDAANDTSPDWSPDGSRIIYTRTYWTGNPDRPEVMMIPSSGGTPQDLTAGLVSNSGPDDPVVTGRWSPDGTQITFGWTVGGYSSGPPTRTDVYLTDQWGNATRNLTGGNGVNTLPAWSPDGDRIAFMSDRSGNDDIYTADMFGAIRQLTTNVGTDTEPDWQRPVRIGCPRPVLLGKAKVGKRLSVAPARLSPALTRASFTWLRGARPIAGATARAYKLKRADAGKRIRVRVMCRAPGLTTVSATSAPKPARR